MKKILIILALVVPLVSFAQSSTTGTPPSSVGGTEPSSIGGTKPASVSGNPNAGLPTLPNPLKVGSIVELFEKIVQMILSIGYVVIALFLILSGFKFVAAQGSEDKLKDAKQTFMYTIIGALIIIGAQTILAVVKSIFTQVGIS